MGLFEVILTCTMESLSYVFITDTLSGVTRSTECKKLLPASEMKASNQQNSQKVKVKNGHLFCEMQISVILLATLNVIQTSVYLCNVIADP